MHYLIAKLKSKFAPFAARTRAFFDSKSNNKFLRSVGILMGGTVFAQAITVFVLPLLTRIYTPDDFSVLGVYASILAITSSIAGMRMELAIPMPESDEDAANILGIALGSSITFSAIIAAVVILVPELIETILSQPALGAYLWMLPLGCWFASSYAALLYWSTRHKKFEIVAKTKLVQAIGGSSIQVGLGGLGVTPFGLLLGHLVTSGAGIFSLAHNAIRENKRVLRTINFYGMRRMLRRYDQFPKYATLEVFANNAGVHIPILIIGTMSPGPLVGYLLLASRAMAVPITLIGSAISQVFLSQAPQAYRSGNLRDLTLSVIKGLVNSGVGPLLFAGVVAHKLFPLVFGDNWGTAGTIIAWMTPWYILQYVTSPVSSVLDITQNLRVAFLLQIFGAVLRILAVLISLYCYPDKVIAFYGVAGFLFYLVYFLVVISIAKIAWGEIWRCILNNFKIPALWILAAISINIYIG